MKKFILAGAILLLAGCSTTNSIPYKPSIDNVVAIQQSVESSGKTVALGDFNFANGVDAKLTCRLMGPIKVTPEDMSEYIKKALQEELFMAKVYSPSSENIITGEVTELSFSSVSPAHWNIGLTVASNGISYSTSVEYPFSTSWDAYSACKNTANAFGGAVQALIKDVVINPKFSQMLK